MDARGLTSEHTRPSRPAAHATFGILSRGEVSEWLMVPLSKSGVRKHRGFESRPLRHSARNAGPRCREQLLGLVPTDPADDPQPPRERRMLG